MKVIEFLEKAEKHRPHWCWPIFNGDGVPLKKVTIHAHEVEFHFFDSASDTLTLEFIVKMLAQLENKNINSHKGWSLDFLEFHHDQDDGDYFDIY